MTQIMKKGVTLLALSVKQPWAHLIAYGGKTIETRTWRTGFRGYVLICSSGSKPLWKLCDNKGDPIDPKLGHALCIAKLVDCRMMYKGDEDKAQCTIYPNAQAWVFEDIRPVEPFPVKGKLKLFEVELPLNMKYLNP
jgi:hypothetical protein